MIRKILLNTVISTGIISTAAILPAYAEETPWEVGAVVTYQAPQVGLKPKKAGFAPYFSKEFKNNWYAIAPQGVGRYVINNGTTKIGVGGWFNAGRKKSDHARVADLAEIKATPTLNIIFDQKINNAWSVSGSLERAFRAHKGIKAQIGVDRNVYANANTLIFLRAGVFAQYTDAKYAQAYYGVTAAEASVSDSIYENKAYNAKAGIDSIGVRLNGQKLFGDKYYMKGTLTFGSAQGSAKDSPITNQRNNTDLVIVFGTYF